LARNLIPNLFLSLVRDLFRQLLSFTSPASHDRLLFSTYLACCVSAMFLFVRLILFSIAALLFAV
jgi:hypothetical protein